MWVPGPAGRRAGTAGRRSSPPRRTWRARPRTARPSAQARRRRPRRPRRARTSRRPQTAARTNLRYVHNQYRMPNRLLIYVITLAARRKQALGVLPCCIGPFVHIDIDDSVNLSSVRAKNEKLLSMAVYESVRTESILI